MSFVSILTIPCKHFAVMLLIIVVPKIVCHSVHTAPPPYPSLISTHNTSPHNYRRKYDTNSTIDRSGSSAYPDGYVQAILSRACCASRGKGAAERKELAKVKGHKGSFQGIYRPKVLDVRCACPTVLLFIYYLRCKVWL